MPESIYCTACKLGCVGLGAGLPILRGEGPLDAKLVFVASHPRLEDMANERPLSGPVGVSVFDAALSRIGVNRKECYVTYLVKHPLKAGQKVPTKKEIEACSVFLDIELSSLRNKKVIVPLGAAPIKALLGHGTVTELRGRPLVWPDDSGVIINATFAPGTFAYEPNPNELKMFDGDLRQAARIAAGEDVVTTTDVVIVQTMEDFDQLLVDINSHEFPIVAADIETSGLNPRTCEIIDISFSARQGTAYVVPIQEWVGDQFRSVAPKSVVDFAKSILADDGIQKIWHNGRFDYTFLVEHGWVDYEQIARQFYMDTMCFHYVGIDESPPHRLEFLAGTYTDMAAWDAEKLAFEAIHGKGSLYRMPYQARAAYAGGDADATWRLYQELPKFAFPDAWKVYNEIMRPMLPGIIEMQVTGAAFDIPKLNEVRALYLRGLRTVEQEVWDIMKDGDDWNVGSYDQVIERMTRCLGFKWQPRDKNKKLWTDTGARPSLSGSTGARDTWEELLPHKVWEPYKRFIMLKKLLDQYAGWSESEFSSKSLPSSVCSVSKRIHTSIAPTTAATSRRASSDPNLQNIPIRSPEGAMLRDCFPASDGYLFCVPDLDTAEAFVAAYISEDKLMIQAFEDPDINIHTQNAALLFNKPYDSIEDKDPERNAAKTFLFGTLYGGQPKSLARKMSVFGVDVSVADVQDMHRRFMERYSGYSSWLTKEVEHVIENGWNETLYGFRRHYTWPRDDWRQHEIIRQLGNHPIQGTVAGHVAKAYRRVQIALRTGIVDEVSYREGGYNGRLVLEVHDEFIAEVQEDQAVSFLPVMIKAMTHPLPRIGLAIPVSGDIRSRWLPDKKRDAQWNRKLA